MSVVLSVYPLIVARKQHNKDVPAAMKIVGGIVFHVVHVISKEIGQFFFPELSL
jgi:hypothetical protein